MQRTNSAPGAKLNFYDKFMNQIYQDWLSEKSCEVQTKPEDVNAGNYDITFLTEIRDMMYICGDVSEPEWSTVLSMSRQLRIYLNILIADSNRIAMMRREKLLEHQSILFQLRKRTEKIRRLLKYMKIKDYKAVIGKKYGDINSGGISERGPRVRDCVQFLEVLFTPEEVSYLKDLRDLDPVTQRKLQRNDSRTQNMSQEEYMEFTEKQKCSFLNDKASFENWVFKDQVISREPTLRSLEIINFLVRDYILEVIDEVLQQRERQQRLSSSSSPTGFQPEIQALPSSSLTGLKKTSSIEKSNKSPSRISAIVNSYLADNSQLLTHSNEVAPILPEEIIFAAQKLSLSGPCTKPRVTIQERTSGINLNPSAATTSRTLIRTTPNSILQKQIGLRLPPLSAKFLSTPKTVSKNVKFSSPSPKTTSETISKNVKFSSPSPKTTSETISKNVKFSTIAPKSSITNRMGDSDATTSKTISKKVKKACKSSTSSDRMKAFNSSTSKTVSKIVNFSTIAPMPSKSSDIISPTPKTTSKTISKNLKFSTNAPKSSTCDRMGEFDSSISKTISKKVTGSKSSTSSDRTSDTNNTSTSKTPSKIISKEVKLDSTNASKSSTSSNKRKNVESSTSGHPRRKITRPGKYANFDLT